MLSLILLSGCGRNDNAAKNATTGPKAKSSITLADARKGFHTQLTRQERENEQVPPPPPELFRVVHYESPVGKLAAYLSLIPQDSRKHPAIIWVVGGFSNSIGETAWEDASPENDQSASAFRKAGIILMLPSFRGGNDNPGFKEGFFGEVDDLLAAADFLARRDGVDPQRIYLGGHSTGGTLVLLAAACSDRFRATFAFGAVDNVAGYGAANLPFNLTERELELRAPRLWMHSIHSPVFLFEGTQNGNLASLQVLASASHNPMVHCFSIRGGDHFSILAPVSRLLADKIGKDDATMTAFSISPQELDNVLGK
jgi:dipeptidyl aminopeptidase/acylaminoacyl peptidase